MKLKNKYLREITPGVQVDVYQVLNAFGVTCPAMAHAIKKCLMPGMRGGKTAEQDKREAIQAIERSIGLGREAVQMVKSVDMGESLNPITGVAGNR